MSQKYKVCITMSGRNQIHTNCDVKQVEKLRETLFEAKHGSVHLDSKDDSPEFVINPANIDCIRIEKEQDDQPF